MPSKTPTLLDQFQLIAEAATALADAVLERFPLAGHPWRSADEYRRDPEQTIMEVLMWVFRLENRINPGRLPFEHSWRGKVDRKSTRLNSSHLVISYAVF